MRRFPTRTLRGAMGPPSERIRATYDGDRLAAWANSRGRHPARSRATGATSALLFDIFHLANRAGCAIYTVESTRLNWNESGLRSSIGRSVAFYFRAVVFGQRSFEPAND